MVRDEPLGRGTVRASLGEAVERAREGRGSVVVLTGEPGIGKTTMARDVADRARRGGAAVRWAACWAGGATVAHGPWLAVLGGLGAAGERALAQLAGAAVDDTVAASSARASAYASVVAALDDASTERPLVVVLDDLHWADEGTVQLLAAVAGQVPALPVLVVATYRDTEVVPGSPLTRLGASADRVALHGLDRDGVAALLSGPLGPARADEVAGEVARRTGGNPFLVVQLGRLLAAEPARGGDRRDLGEGGLPAGARDLLAGRLAALAPDDRGVLVAAAVLGNTFTTADLAALVDVPVTDAAGALDRAATARVVERVAGVGSWAFVHDLFREATLEPTSDQERRELHRRAAAVLAGADAEPAVVAHHLLAASSGRSTDAARWSVRAGDRALGGLAWEEAAAHYERALSAVGSTEGDDDVRADALLGLGRARILIGDPHAAGRAFEQCAELARRNGSAALLARAALGFSVDVSGFEVRLFDQRQIDLLEEAATALEASAHEELRATVLARLSVALSLTAPRARRLALAETAVDLARGTADATVLGRCLAAHCDAIASPDHVTTRLEEATEIVAIGEGAGDAPLELLGRRLRFVALLELGDFTGADAEAGAFARRADAAGNPLYSWYVALWAGQRALVDGDVAGCETAVDEVRRIGRAAGSTNAEMLALVLWLVSRWVAGDHEGAVQGMVRLAVDNPELAQHLSSAGGFARSYALAGRVAEANVLLDRCQAVGYDTLPFDAEWLPNVVALLDAATLTRHASTAALAQELRPYTDLVAFEGIGAGLYGSVARSVATADSLLGDHETAVALARRAVEVNLRAGGVLAADALRTLAECLGRRAAPGDGDEAVDLHERADAAYLASGVTHRTRDTPPPVATFGVAGAGAAADFGALNELRRDGDVWHVAYAGTTTIVKHSKGVADLALLLGAPGREFHVGDLETVPRVALEGDPGEAIDRRAVAEYKQRLADLAEELDDADAAHDTARAERARAEHDALVDELSRSLGLGGRARPGGATAVERLRKAVSARIRDAIRRIGAVHPELGRHLANSVRTGVFCSYQPEQPVDWHCQS